MRTIELTIEINDRNTDENQLRQYSLCDDESHVEQRVEQAIDHYWREQGCNLRWRAVENGVEIRNDCWGYAGDDYTEPPTVGNEVI